MNFSFMFTEHHRSYQDKSYTCCRFDLHNYLAEKVYTNYNIFLHRQFQLQYYVLVRGLVSIVFLVVNSNPVENLNLNNLNP